MLGAVFNMEAGFGGRAQFRGRFVLHGGQLFSIVNAKPVILCCLSSTKGGVHETYLIRGFSFVPPSLSTIPTEHLNSHAVFLIV
jgi:hypothetical protein